jgi:hypothetical protein
MWCFPEPNPTTAPTLEGLARAEDMRVSLLLVSKAKTQPHPISEIRLINGPVAEAGKDSASRENDYSTTNIQVEGVDEADIIKTDGRYLYLVANNRLLIVDAADPTGLKVVAVKPFAGSEETDTQIINETPTEMYLDIENDRLTLIVSGSISEKRLPEPEETTPAPDPSVPDETKPVESSSSDSGESGAVSGSSGEDSGKAVDEAELAPASKVAIDRIWYPYYNTRNYTTTIVYDIGDKTNPVIIRQFSQDGYYATSRKVGSAVYVVTNRYDYRVFAEDAKDLDPADVFPAVCEDPKTDTGTLFQPIGLRFCPTGYGQPVDSCRSRHP